MPINGQRTSPVLTEFHLIIIRGMNRTATLLSVRPLETFDKIVLFTDLELSNTPHGHGRGRF
jgi:hypothetical protein